MLTNAKPCLKSENISNSPNGVPQTCAFLGGTIPHQPENGELRSPFHPLRCYERRPGSCSGLPQELLLGQGTRVKDMKGLGFRV